MQLQLVDFGICRHFIFVLNIIVSRHGENVMHIPYTHWMIGVCGMHHQRYLNGLFTLQWFIMLPEDLGLEGFYLGEKSDHTVNVADAGFWVTTDKHARVMFPCSLGLHVINNFHYMICICIIFKNTLALLGLHIIMYVMSIFDPIVEWELN